ncbi:MAG: nucleotidyltransferase domain-containing protein [Sedimentisphaerales bacterium]|jgi:predicted nucleotidyltransferase
MQIEQILKEFRENITQLYKKRLKSIILYGSWARGTATDNSDIDLAIVLESDVAAGREIDRMIDIVTEINLKYGVLISIYPVSEKDYASVNSPLLLNLRREGVAA